MKIRGALLGLVGSGRESRTERKGILRVVIFHYGMAFAIWLPMLSKKLRLVLAYSGVVPWNALRRVWEDGATGSHNLDAPYTHGGNVPFQYQNRSMKCMHRIPLNEGSTI